MDLDLAQAAPPPADGAAGPQRRRLKLDPVEALLLLTFGLVSCWTIGIDLYEVWVHHHVWTMTDGTYITDQMQYMAWVQSAADHGLVSDMFVLRHTPADYFQPAVEISAGLVKLGFAPWLALIVWKPVAVAATFFGIRVYVHRSVRGSRARRNAIALALFYGSFTVIYGSFSVIGDEWLGFLSWGYSFGLIALGATLWALVIHDRDRSKGGLALGPGALGAIASLLHPWNGETLIAILVLSELLCLRRDGLRRRNVERVIVTCVMTGLPLVYYFILGKADPTWGMARMASKHNFPLWWILLTLVPIAPFAALAYRTRPQGFWDVSVRVFPLVAFIIYLLSASGASATPLHAFQGITVPLAVLAVQGLATTAWDRWRYHRVAGIAALLLATIPNSVWELKNEPPAMGPQSKDANFITADESHALAYLKHSPERGGVLSQGFLGVLIPGITNHQSYLGDCLWAQPDCPGRAKHVNDLFTGKMTMAQARRFVQSTPAVYAAGGCTTVPKAERQLRTLSLSVHRFGCATVYRLKPRAH